MYISDGNSHVYNNISLQFSIEDGFFNESNELELELLLPGSDYVLTSSISHNIESSSEN